MIHIKLHLIFLSYWSSNRQNKLFLNIAALLCEIALFIYKYKSFQTAITYTN